MATAYHRDQAGAPALTYSTSTGVEQFTAFKAILLACLVNGYAGRPASGWQLIQEGINTLILRNGSYSGYICFYYASGAITVSVCEAYSQGGIASGLIVGDGVKSGVAAGNSTPHKFMIRALVQSSATTSWAVFADEKTCILLMGSNGVSTSAGDLTGSAGGASYAIGAFYFGEDSNGNFIACGGENTAATGITAANMYFGAAGFSSLRYPDTGLLVDTGSIVVTTPSLYYYSFTPNQYGSALPAAYLTPLSWQSGQIFGNFRGLCTEARALHNNPHYGAAMLGYKGDTLTTRTFNTNVPLDDEYTYFVAPRYAQYSAFFLLTDNPEFW
jgi:hypothetical protein